MEWVGGWPCLLYLLLYKGDKVRVVYWGWGGHSQGVILHRLLLHSVQNRRDWKVLHLWPHSLLTWVSLVSSHIWSCSNYSCCYSNVWGSWFTFPSIDKHTWPLFCEYGSHQLWNSFLMLSVVSGLHWVNSKLRSRFWLNQLLMTWTWSSHFIVHCPLWSTNQVCSALSHLSDTRKVPQDSMCERVFYGARLGPLISGVSFEWAEKLLHSADF